MSLATLYKHNCYYIEGELWNCRSHPTWSECKQYLERSCETCLKLKDVSRKLGHNTTTPIIFEITCWNKTSQYLCKNVSLHQTLKSMSYRSMYGTSINRYPENTSRGYRGGILRKCVKSWEHPTLSNIHWQSVFSWCWYPKWHINNSVRADVYPTGIRLFEHFYISRGPVCGVMLWSTRPDSECRWWYSANTRL